MRQLLIKFRADRTQAKVAQKYGVTQQAWSKWEKGIDTPKPHIMKQLEIDSQIPMEELFFDVFNNHKLLNDINHHEEEPRCTVESKLAG